MTTGPFIVARSPARPAARVLAHDKGRTPEVVDSILSTGVIVSGARVVRLDHRAALVSAFVVERRGFDFV